nr:MAG TPA: hypothetical protein [Caudoviricetes sp.]
MRKRANVTVGGYDPTWAGLRASHRHCTFFLVRK